MQNPEVTARPESARRVKLTLLGEAAVGKSSIALRFVANAFNEKQESTIGAFFLTDTVTTHLGDHIRLEIWDTAGQERFHCLAPMYYRNAQVALVVYDVSSRVSFDRAQVWVTEIQAQGKPDVVIGLAANKADLSSELWEVDAAEGKNYAEDKGLLYCETSAKTGHNVKEVFLNLARLVPHAENRTVPQKEEVVFDQRCCVIS